MNTVSTIREVIAHPAAPYDLAPGTVLPPESQISGGLLETLLSRRSRRSFDGSHVALEDVSALLRYSCGVTAHNQDSHGNVWGLRCAPSGGALFPLDTYCAALRVDGLVPGRYAYDPEGHQLRLVGPGDAADDLGGATYLREESDLAGLAVVLVANLSRSEFKYGERGYRFILLEAGHIMQNLLIVAEALGLAAVPVGGFVDRSINRLFALDGYEQVAVYMALFGTPAE
ncbi:SagB/ThcOx family dehydrogenase [Nocardioides sp. LHG3406-4]|uniref:SagB/ThcOx family dehydrogenase n=1 Tax=Nocardioides sp. LHG3406-4 TaxID=2804575 RepID=UPI003CF97750